MHKDKSVSGLKILTVPLVYLVISLILTYPLIFSLKDTLWGGYGDSFANVYNLWLEKNYGNEVNELISVPYGSIKLSEPHPVYIFLQKVPLFFLDEISAYNILVILSFPLTAFAMFFLVYWLIGDIVISAISGFIFGFCPFAVAHSIGGHLSFAMNFWIPLYIFSILLIVKKDRYYFPSLLAGVSYAALVLTSTYHGYILIFYSLFFFIFTFFQNKDSNPASFLRLIVRIALAAVISLALIIPFEMETFKAIVKDTGGEGSLFYRPFIELLAYSAKPWQYLIPSIDHTFFGRMVTDFTRNHLYGSNVIESTLYLGVIPVTTAFAGIWLRRRRCLLFPELFNLFLFMAIIMIIFSAPPYIPLGGDPRNPTYRVPLISTLLYRFAPMFRVYSRFALMTVFSLSVTTAIVLFSIIRMAEYKKRKVLIILSVSLITLVDFWGVPFNKAISISKTPDVYKWLASETEDIVIAEYPNVSNIDYNYYEYLFWQRIHKKRMINGASPGTDAWKAWERVKEISSPGLAIRLKRLGVKYVIVHKKKYRDGSIPGPIKRYYPPKISDSGYYDNNLDLPSMPEGFYFVVSFGDDVIYSLIPEKALMA